MKYFKKGDIVQLEAPELTTYTLPNPNGTNVRTREYNVLKMRIINIFFDTEEYLVDIVLTDENDGTIMRFDFAILGQARLISSF